MTNIKMPTITSDIIKFAMKFEGYKEGVNNANMFGAYFGLNNCSWCALFVSYCLLNTGYKTLFELKNLNGYLAGCFKTGTSYVPSVQTYFKSKGLFKDHNPVQGDIAIYCFDGSGIGGHIGFYIGYDAVTNEIITIEGNTSNLNPAEGDTVAVKKRARHLCLGFISNHK